LEAPDQSWGAKIVWKIVNQRSCPDMKISFD